MKALRILLVIIILTGFLTGCAGMSHKQQRVLSGGAIGAGAGAVISVIAGTNIAVGSAIGAGAGAVGGYIYDQSKKHHRR